MYITCITNTRKAPSRGRTSCYLFTVSNSGLLSVQCQPVDHAHRHSPTHCVTDTCGVNSIDYYSFVPIHIHFDDSNTMRAEKRTRHAGWPLKRPVSHHESKKHRCILACNFAKRSPIFKILTAWDRQLELVPSLIPTAPSPQQMLTSSPVYSMLSLNLFMKMDLLIILSLNAST